MRHEAAQGTSPELSFIPFIGQFFQSPIGPRQGNVHLLLQTVAEVFQQNTGNIEYLFFFQRFKDDNVINTVQKFRADLVFYDILNRFFSRLEVGSFKNFMRT